MQFLLKYKKQIEIIANIITISIFPFVGYQILQANQSLELDYKTLQLSTDPEIDIYPQKIWFDDVTFVDVQAYTPHLQLKNNFFGDLENIRIYKDFIIIMQDKNNHDDIWVCDYPGKTVFPIVSTTSLTANSVYNFSFNYNDDVLSMKYLYDQVGEYLAYPFAVIRLRVHFDKKEGKAKFSKDFYYMPYSDSEESSVFLRRYPDNYVRFIQRTKQGVVGKDMILNMLETANHLDSSERCTVQDIKRWKGLPNWWL